MLHEFMVSGYTSRGSNPAILILLPFSMSNLLLKERICSYSFLFSVNSFCVGAHLIGKPTFNSKELSQIEKLPRNMGCYKLLNGFLCVQD